jgi:hypothetical protein
MLPGGMGGMFPGGMYPGGFGGTQGGSNANYTPLLAVAVIEVKGRTLQTVAPGVSLNRIGHKWALGSQGSFVVPETADKRITARLLKIPPVQKRFEEEQKRLSKGPKAGIDALLALAEWALQHGLLKEFVSTMEQAAQVDSNHPSVVAFQKVHAAVSKPASKPDNAAEWRRKLLETYKLAQNDHYSLLHNLTSETAREVKSRLDRLDDTFRTYFYWFALKGKALPVPEQRLVAVLVAGPEQFERQHQIFESVPLVADGFLARRENLAVFSLDRLDAASVALRKNTERIWQQFDRDGVLRKFPARTDILKGAEIQTLALLQKALEEDSEIATVTHEGTRQLLAATGLLPRNVVAPNWIQFGWASFFGTPKGSAWISPAAPSATPLSEYNYLAYYKNADKEKKLEKNRHETLEKVVTDAYFREAAAQPKDADARIKAQSMAWALTYFLAHRNLDGLLKYHEELKKLPRDLEFDSDTLLQCFARAFDLLDPATQNVDKTRLARLADGWHNFISLTPLPAEKVIEELTKNQNELKTGTVPGTGTTPGRPGVPPGGGGPP